MWFDNGTSSNFNNLPHTNTRHLTQNTVKMLAKTAVRASTMTTMVARRGFSTTRAQMSSPYHYPEGPRNNLPFNPLTKFFFLRYWGFMTAGFAAPFAIAYWQLHKNKT